MHDDRAAEKAKETARIGRQTVEACSITELVAYMVAKNPKTFVITVSEGGFEILRDRSLTPYEQMGMLTQASTMVEMNLKMHIAARMEAQAQAMQGPCTCPKCSPPPFTPPGGPLANG